MTIWFTEEDTQNLKFSYAVQKTLFSGQSKFQRVEVVETNAYGKMLIIDDCVMLTEDDEFVYHEMISHIPALLHPNPKKVLVIGGGDGGTVREILKHNTIEKVVLAEIDQMVIDVCKKYFPQVSVALNDPRADLEVGDGVAYIQRQENTFDIIIIDSTDPIGPGEGLFTADFYKSVARALKPDGLMVAQSESPWYSPELLRKIHRNINAGFPYVAPYIGSVPTYPRGLWSWTLASKHPIDPKSFHPGRFSSLEGQFKYLTEEIFSASFSLPPFYARKLSDD